MQFTIEPVKKTQSVDKHSRNNDLAAAYRSLAAAKSALTHAIPNMRDYTDGAEFEADRAIFKSQMEALTALIDSQRNAIVK